VYLLFEGIDGCGKSTQIEKLKETFSDIITTKEPAGTALGVKIRELILNGEEISKEAETLLFLADRAEHFNRVIKPNRDKLIVSDRGFISGVAYSLTNQDANPETLKLLNSYALQNNFPDFIFLFWIDENSLKDRLNRSLDNIEKRGFEYLLRVQENMRVAVEYFKIPYKIVDASLDIETIHKEIVQNIDMLIDFNKNSDIIISN
jgi:dTMP kinase